MSSKICVYIPNVTSKTGTKRAAETSQNSPKISSSSMGEFIPLIPLRASKKTYKNTHREPGKGPEMPQEFQALHLEKPKKKHREPGIPRKKKTTKLMDDLLIWVFPQMVVPPKYPKMIILVGKAMVVGYHHFRKPPFLCGYLFLSRQKNNGPDLGFLLAFVDGPGLMIRRWDLMWSSSPLILVKQVVLVAKRH